jgi:hypothetical protein
MARARGLAVAKERTRAQAGELAALSPAFSPAPSVNSFGSVLPFRDRASPFRRDESLSGAKGESVPQNVRPQRSRSEQQLDRPQELGGRPDHGVGVDETR